MDLIYLYTAEIWVSESVFAEDVEQRYFKKTRMNSTKWIQGGNFKVMYY